jgi:hypothetical protein
MTTYLDAMGSDKSLSRYKYTKTLIDINNAPVQESWFRELFEDRDDDIFYQVPPECEFRPDLISESVYGVAWLYWIVAFAAGMVDAFAETYVNRKLRLPSYDYVYTNIINR